MSVDVDALQEALAATGAEFGPGVYGLVTEGGHAVFAGSAGTADLESPRPIEARDRYRIGSITKTFTATLVLQLAADGVLALDDTVHKLLPGLVPGGSEITVEMLLRLRSGLPDTTAAMFGESLTDLSALERYWSPRQLIAAALSTGDFLPPDSRYRYSNTDYILLGMLVEEATGERVDAQMWQRIFKPLNLADTTFPTVDPYLRGPHAKGYLHTAPDAPYLDVTNGSPSEGFTAGAIVSTAADVAAFLDGLFGGVLLPERYLARMIEPTERFDEYRSRGLGVFRLDFGTGHVAYGHQGGSVGYTTYAARTESGRCIVVWQNGANLYGPLSSDCAFFQAALRG